MRKIQKGSTNRSVDVYIIDSTTGVPETGVLFNTAGMDLKYRRDVSAVVSITEATLAALTTAHTDGGFLEIGNGVYRFDLPDAAWATGADHVVIFGTVTGMIVLPQTIQLVDYDPEDAVRLGLTALPNAAADAAGGLPISDAGGLDMDSKLAATNEVTAARMAALTDWIDGGRLDLLLDAIPTTAMRGTDGALTDKTGFSLSTAGILAIWHQLNSAIVTAGSMGKLLKDEITAARMATLTDWINGGRLDLLLDAIPTTAMRGTDGVDTATMRGTDGASTHGDPDPGGLIANLDAAISTRATPAQVLTTALTEAYAADGAASTLSEILYLILAILTESNVSGTTLTAKKLDGSTTAATLTLDDGTNPTSITRAT